ncbi:CLUMA_CG018964, isoform A [Clunio marinus]|uniref:CLUMA_CG018964, isoform A n=1 Tax=Clunio marinus TaxID=568069 RepID=A0A1J1J480_9DIPT|nr:CLUMA_CG018964, isoform A [Clunio marinus]
MFVQDLRQEFYNLLIGKRVIIIANSDVDSIVASKILQSLFRNEQIIFTFVPIMGVKGLKRTFDDNKNDCNIFLLINCGGCLDLIDLLAPEENIFFFVCDSHRPLDLCNIYSDSQVRILGDPKDEEEIPQFDEIFQESENEDSEDDENSDIFDGDDPESRPSTNIEKFEKRMKKNREKREWEKKRDRILFNYSQNSYYTRSSALVFFELAWQMSKDSLDLLWWAIVGVTEQLLMGKRESSTYTLETQKIQSHVTRLNTKMNGGGSTHTSIRITYENDLYLALYRHWSIRESIQNSVYSACKMKLWTLNGKKKLNELLVEMGLPLSQANQQFNSMDLLLKNDFYQMIEKTSEKYNMNEIIYGSFTLQYGYKNRFSAADYVYAMIALMEQIEYNRTAESCFLEALESVSRNKKMLLETGIEKAKVLLDAVFKQVKTSLEMQQVFSAGPFLYLILQEENILFSSPYGLSMLAKFILNGYIATSRKRRVRELPLIVAIPVDSSREINLMVGIPPIGDDVKNLFGKAFETAAIKSNSAVSQDFFDTNVIQIKQADCPKFIDALTVIMLR